MKPPFISPALCAFVALVLLTNRSRAGQGYDLSHVDGIESFAGSAQAQDLLATNGFVVAAPAFRQIFEPYIESPLPVLITVDSAWHTYHFLLEHGIKEMESSKSAMLVSFSRALLAAANEQAGKGAAEFRELANYAAIGLAFQDPTSTAHLEAEQKQIVVSLISGETPVRSPIGFELSPQNFRPQSFYTQSPQLTGYYHARQWYANVDFRLSNDHETRLALCLAWLIHSRPDLTQLWKSLTTPYDALVGTAEDGTVSDYFKSIENALGTTFNLATLQKRMPEIAGKLRSQPKLPRINDQLLDPAAYSNFPQVTAGFRLLPARQLPCAVCLQNCVDPKVKGRLCPSGLDFFAASSVLRSPAALRAARNQFGESVLTAVLAADPGVMPNSLYGDSMLLLKTLNEPLPAQVPTAFRTEAWADLKLWTQLGAWAEQRHTWALHAKPNVEYLGMTDTPPGIVEPYPEFFAGLAALCRKTAGTLEGSAPGEPFNPRKVAAEVIETKSILATGDKKDVSAERMRQYAAFMQPFWAKEQNDVPNELLKRLAQSGPTNQFETDLLRNFYDARFSIPQMLTNFASVCDQLAVLAGKELAGTLPTEEEARWITGYGITLAGFHFYEGNSWLTPSDDFSILSRIFHIPIKGTVLYAAVAQPQALYVVLPYKDRMQLYRGAVLNYREFEKPEGENVTDESWQNVVRHGSAPPAPAFTASFLHADAPDAAQTNRLKAVAFAAQDFTKPPAPSITLQIKQTRLAPMPAVLSNGFDGEQMMSSDDERHVIVVEKDGAQQRLVRDGVAEKSYDMIGLELFSQDSKHVVYVGGDKGGQRVVLDGVEGKTYAEIEPLRRDLRFVFSSNSAHVAYQASVGPKQVCVVVDKTEGEVYDQIVGDSFSFSANSEHFIYAATRGKKGFVAKDQKVVVECDADGWDSVRQGPYLSADGQRFACLIKRGSQWFANVDGKNSRPWQGIGNSWQTSLSPDGAHFSYDAHDERGFFTLLDDQEFHGTLTPALFGANGKSWAVINQDETGCWVVVNGKPGKKYHGTILADSFSPDGRRLGYLVDSHQGGGPMAVIHGEREFENTEPELFGGISFSPDSAHFAISGKRGGKSVVIIDGKQYPASDMEDSHTTVSFSPNSTRWAYLAVHGGRTYWIVSGVEYGPYGTVSSRGPTLEERMMNVDAPSIQFSPDDRHFAFRVTRDDRNILVVDGLERELDMEWFPHSRIIFDSPTHFHLLVRNQKDIHLVEADIEQK